MGSDSKQRLDLSEWERVFRLRQKCLGNPAECVAYMYWHRAVLGACYEAWPAILFDSTTHRRTAGEDLKTMRRQ